MHEGFERAVDEFYGGGVSEADFPHRLEDVKRLVKEWVREQTDGMIPDYESAATEDAVADILNVVCFKGSWTSPFDPSDTEIEDFRNADGTVSEAEMMSGTFSEPMYYDDWKHRGLALTYGDASSDLRLNLVLPSDPGCLDVLGSWRSETAEYRERFLRSIAITPDFVEEAVVLLPRIDLSATFDLADAARRMGMTSTFGEPSFSRILDGFPLMVQGGKHQARMLIDEEGTEAAAVTELVLIEGCPMDYKPPMRFICDRPFVFVLSSNGEALFVGYVGNAEELSPAKKGA